MPNGLPFVVHQWLTDVIFYVLVKNFGSISLIFLAALTTSIAFILVPLRILSLTAVSIRLAVPIVTILALASCAHMNIRPEIFSYSLLAVLMEILLRTDQFDKVNGATAISLVMLVIAWCNLHSSFVMGPVLLTLWCTLSFIDATFFRIRTVNPTCWLALPFCWLATLVNPAGIKLWLYLPHMFFTPLNPTINEMHSIDWHSLTSPIYYPYFILSGTFFFLLYKRIKYDGINKVGLKFPFFGLLAIAQGASAQRMLTFAAISLLPPIAVFLKGRSPESSTSTNLLEKLMQRQRVTSTLLCLSTVLAGTLLVCWAIPPEVPESTKAFHAPVGAMAFLDRHPQTGRLLNDPHFGDAMMWRMGNCPPLFLDSRYDVFDTKLVSQYWDMVLCRNDWQHLMQSLQIDWIILPPQTALVQTLSKDPLWKTLYSDSAATILRKNDKDKDPKCDSTGG